jgi:hypothetical protein
MTGIYIDLILHPDHSDGQVQGCDGIGAILWGDSLFATIGSLPFVSWILIVVCRPSFLAKDVFLDDFDRGSFQHDGYISSTHSDQVSLNLCCEWGMQLLYH